MEKEDNPTEVCFNKKKSIFRKFIDIDTKYLTYTLCAIACIISAFALRFAAEPRIIYKGTINVSVAQRTVDSIPIKWQKSVLQIEVNGNRGSGTIIDEHHILTCKHMAMNVPVVDAKIEVTRDVWLPAKIIGVDPNVDLMMLYSPAAIRQDHCQLATIDNTTPGDLLIIIGASYGADPNNASSGTLTGKDNRHMNGHEYMWHCSVSIYPGNSGGPVIHKKTGEIIGIASCVPVHPMAGISTNVSYFVPYDKIIKFINTLKIK